MGELILGVGVGGSLTRITRYMGFGGDSSGYMDLLLITILLLLLHVLLHVLLLVLTLLLLLLRVDDSNQGMEGVPVRRLQTRH